MAREHRVYQSIVQAIQAGELEEPFSKKDFQKSCPGFGEGTYQAFLYKHRKGNPGRSSELFEQVEKNLFVVIRPFKYGLRIFPGEK